MAKEVKTESSAPVVEAERKFTVSVLRGNSVKLFGCTSSTFDGAFFGHDKSAEYTVSDAKKIIENWLGKTIGKEKE